LLEAVLQFASMYLDIYIVCAAGWQGNCVIVFRFCCSLAAHEALRASEGLPVRCNVLVRGLLNGGGAGKYSRPKYSRHSIVSLHDCTHELTTPLMTTHRPAAGLVTDVSS
jgi:hypothetical protein